MNQELEASTVSHVLAVMIKGKSHFSVSFSTDRTRNVRGASTRHAESLGRISCSSNSVAVGYRTVWVLPGSTGHSTLLLDHAGGGSNTAAPVAATGEGPATPAATGLPTVPSKRLCTGCVGSFKSTYRCASLHLSACFLAS